MRRKNRQSRLAEYLEEILDSLNKGEYGKRNGIDLNLIIML